MQTLFWLLLVAAGFSYFVYPVLLSLLPARRASESYAEAYEPLVAIIIPAYNEASRIAEKLENTLAIDYPKDKVQILVASDASSDDTDAIVASYRDRGVDLVRLEGRRGKEYAQAQAIRLAAGALYIFSDAATIIPEDSIRIMVDKFRDPKVGAVSSEDVILDSEGGRTGESAYVRYEMWLRRQETRVNSLIGLSGSFFAARKEVCGEWDHLVPGDFNVALNCARQGYVAISCPDVLGYYKQIADESREYERKLRTVIHGFSAIRQRSEVLNPLRYGLFSFQIWGHKIMRWLVPWLAIPLLLANAALWDSHAVYRFFFCCQVLFYLMALAGYLSPRLREWLPIKLPYYFVQVNAALFHAALLFIRGERMASWEPSAR